MQQILKWLMIAAGFFGPGPCAMAEDSDAAKAEYVARCSGCHGEDAKGNGPLSGKLTRKPADLTILSKKNKGVFPVSALYGEIDGRSVSDAHGSRDMPIWGCRSTPWAVSPSERGKRKPSKLDPYESHLDLACDPEDVIANRILSVVEYLRRIQEK
jgi:hypothetical protein